jgi:hypothetical protein
MQKQNDKQVLQDILHGAKSFIRSVTMETVKFSSFTFHLPDMQNKLAPAVKGLTQSCILSCLKLRGPSDALKSLFSTISWMAV